MKALVVLSGGMDSSTALRWAIERWSLDQVSSITFNYGSKHNARENESAKLVCERLGVRNVLINLPFINQYFKSDLLNSGGQIPEGHYAEESMKRTVVPYRNAIMLSIAAGYATSIGAKELVLGNHAGDHAIYPDCRLEFTKPFEQALLNGDWNPVSIIRPFESLSKADIVKVGTALNVPYLLTWSCYKGGDIHCGRCGTCVERAQSFAEVGVIDPVPYEDKEFFKSVLAPETHS